MTGLTVKRLGHHGDGIAAGLESDVFAPFTLPGEIIEGAISSGRMAQPRVIQPSDHRVKPPCSHFKSCGGCSLQHASDAFLADWKLQLVKDALAAQGLDAEFAPITTSPPGSRRRATLTGKRTKKGALVGFHVHRSENIIPIPNCTLLHPDIIAAIPALEAMTKIGASRKGTIALAVTQSVAGLDVDVTGAKDADGPLAASLGAVVEIYGLARLTWNGEPVATRGLPVQLFGRAHVVPPPGGFLQATRAGQDALVLAVKQAVGDVKHIVDLFAGCGTFTLPLAEEAEVLAVESNAPALAALDTAWRATPGLKAVATAPRDLFRRPLLPDELNRFDAVVIDPPRAGAAAQCVELARSTVSKIAFVSCNPTTFARDAKTLTNAGFRLNKVQVVDQFRWSPHVELVACLSRDPARTPAFRARSV